MLPTSGQEGKPQIQEHTEAFKNNMTQSDRFQWKMFHNYSEMYSTLLTAYEICSHDHVYQAKAYI